MSDAKISREGERRREECPHYIGDIVVQYRRLYGAGEDKAAIVVKTPDHEDLVIGPLRSAMAKEVFDSIRRSKERVAQFEIKIGDRVRVRGDYDDCTKYFDGEIGVVIEVRNEKYNDYLVRFDDSHNGNRVLRVWSYNILEVFKR